ncbi:TMEM175 family protein [Streptomyces sp. AM 2-1-1]|uniref:TMEM175 family protein n=1 Tax=Streptomyces sp. AM 2-1-1 TaxID=3028709 RepID=UPI0023B92199|nr:TMEM175 family protein [Streptomyces sp. AM 2-1-1]WEH42375.1 TMEM175 family protein [Streptomyces sp. AM 2-1-1]
MSDERAGSGTGDATGAGDTVRLTALSDGIFAIAMTLLVLDVRVPPGLDDARFRDAVRDALPDLGAYALSFVILAGFWRDHRRTMALVPRFEGAPLRLALVWLGAIAFLPFPTSLLSEYASEPLAVAVYAGTVAVTNLLGLGVLLTGRSGPTGRGKAGAPVRAAVRTVTTDSWTTALVFGASVPLAFAVRPVVAIWFWLAVVPLRALVRGSRRS